MPIQEPFADVPSPLPEGYVCYQAPKPLKLDGSLPDPAWKSAPWTDEFVDIEGDKKPKPRFRTRAKMLWDADFLYIGAEMEEPDVWATLTEHDSVIFQDNDFEVFIDPNGDNHLYGEIEVNAFGTEWDLLLPKPYKDGGTAINGWGIPGLKVAVHVDGRINEPGKKGTEGPRDEGTEGRRDKETTFNFPLSTFPFRDKGTKGPRDGGWSVEIAIPWKALAEIAGRECPPKHGDQWRINFSRVEWQIKVENGKYVKLPNTPEDNWVWSPQGVIDMHRPERWGYLQFSSELPGSDAFKPDPDWPAKDFLHKLYYAQRAAQSKSGKFKVAIKDLISEAEQKGFARHVDSLRLQITDSGFEASVACADGKGRFHIREDSRIWRA